MKNFSILLSTVALILAAVATVNTHKNPTVSSEGGSAVSEEFTSQVAAALKEKPQIIVDAMQKYQDDMREAAEKEAQKALESHIDEINSDASAPSIGPKDAKVVVVEFFDFSCGYCKRLAPELAKVIAGNADVKFIFKPLSFLAPISAYQAKAAMAAHQQGKFVDFYKKAMAERLNETQTDELAKSLGLDMDQYKKDMNSKETAENLEKISQLAEAIKVHGVPTVLINGKLVQTMSADDLQNAINAAK